MPVINGVYLKDFPALPSAVADANIIPIAITGNQIAYRTTVAGIVTDARVTSKLLTGLSVTGSTILATDTILQAFGKVQNQLNGKVSSVGLTMPAAFNVANSPITSAGTLAVTAAGVASQYIRGDGALADFPTTGGGGSSVSYYLNGSVSQGTFVGNTYYEMNKNPVIGAGTDFTIGADGYIAQFITDANDPASLLIPAGNWNVEMYFSASSSGGTPSFYVEVYKYNGTTFTLLGSSSATPEGITNGTAIDIYYTSVGIPETVLTITDRLAIRVYVTHSGRTITLHTEDNHLSEIVTTFSNGLTTLNGLTKQAQYFAVGSTGTDFAIVSSVDTHTFNIPSASATARGLITTGTQTIAGDKTLTGALTGTTATFTNSGAGIGIDVTNSSSGDGIKITHSLGRAFRIESSSTGYGILINNLTASTSVPFTIQKQGSTVITMSDTGAANFTGQLTLGSTITNGTYTYTLPSATGTLALTSALSGYVDLTTNQSIAGEKTFTDKLTVSFGASSSAAIQATTTNAGGKALSCLADSTSEPFTVKQLGSGKLATFFRQIAGTPDERVTILNDGSIYTGGKVAIGTISAGNGGVDSVVVRNSTDTELKIVGTTGTGSAVFSASPTFTGTINAAAVTLTGALSGTSATFSGNGNGVTLSASTGTTNTQYKVNNTGGDNYFGVSASDGSSLFTGTTAYSGYIGTNNAYPLQLATGGTVRLTIASTGAATFINGAAKLFEIASNTATGGYTRFTYNTSTSIGYIGSSSQLSGLGIVSDLELRADNNLFLTTTGGSLKLASTGAATFTIPVESPASGTVCLTAKTSNGANDIFRWYDGTTQLGVFKNSGSIGIGTLSPAYQLQLSTDSAAKPSTNTWTISSDSRLKENITPYTKGLSAIMAINPVNYDYNGKAGFSAIKNNIGVIAQDVLEILPESISTYKAKLEENDAEDTELYNFNSHALTYILINAIKELKAEIDLLKGEPITPTDNNLE